MAELNFNDNWGDFNDGLVNRPATGQEVQDFIKNQFNDKITYLFSIDATEYSMLLGFANAESYEEWQRLYDANPEEAMLSKLIVGKTQINKSQPQPYTMASLENKYEGGNTYISIDNTVRIPIRYSYKLYEWNGSEMVGSDIPDKGILTIEKYDSTGNFISSKTLEINSNEDTTLDLTDFIQTAGSYQLKMTVVSSGGQSSLRPLFFNKVILTSIGVNLTTPWAKPIKVENNQIALKFSYSGNYVDKYLNIELTHKGSEGTIARTNYRNLGDVNGEQTYFITYDKNKDTVQLNKHGIWEVKYWINVNGDDKYKTQAKTVNLMFVADNSDTSSYIIYNNIKGDTEENSIYNWMDSKLFDYAIYAPGAESEDYFPISIPFSNTKGEELFAYTFDEVIPGNTYSCNVDFSIEDDQSLIQLYYRAKDQNDEDIKSDKEYRTLYIRNDGDYSPITGADFILNPRTRTNEDVDKTSISGISCKFDNFSFNQTDGWISDSNNRKCLRVLDGERLSIPYYPFAKNDDNKNVVIDMTVAVNNIMDETTPLIRIMDSDGDSYSGFELRGSDAYFLSKQTKDQEVLNDCDIMFEESKKLHISLCLNYDEIPEFSSPKDDGSIQITSTLPKSYDIDKSQPVFGSSPVNKARNFFRIYVNGVLNRVGELGNFDFDDPKKPSRQIIIGSLAEERDSLDKLGSDIDIYDLRVYRKSSYTPFYEVMKNYVASLSTSEDKDDFISRNSILPQSGSNINASIFRNDDITYSRAQELGYNTLLWMPGEENIYSSEDDKGVVMVRPSGREFEDSDKKRSTYNKGNLEISIYKTNSNGVREIDQERSGTYSNLTNEGQGTSACYYYKWNQRFSPGKIKIDGKKVKSKFTNRLGKELSGYNLNDEDPIAKRLDGKINWASSMQTHKMGSVNLYHDCWKNVIRENGLTELKTVDDFSKIDLERTTGDPEYTATKAYESACDFTGRTDAYGSCRVSVRQEPFLFFVQPLPNADIKYYSMLTFGASKGDKPTFGYNEDFNRYFVMIEGSDQDRDIISGVAPWDDKTSLQKFDPKEDNEVDGPFVYNGYGQFEIGMGDSRDTIVGPNWEGTEDDAGNRTYNPCLVMFKDMVNFIYLHNPHLNYVYTYTELPKEPNTKEKRTLYWINTDYKSDDVNYERYDLFRYDKIEEKWVPAGLWDKDKKEYKVLNLKDQLGLSTLDGTAEDTNSIFIANRAKKFREGYKGNPRHKYGFDSKYPNGIEDFMHKDDLLYTMQMLKLIAASDNWCKNTYFYNTGLYYKSKGDGTYEGGSAIYGGLDKFRFFQDDLDTIFAVNNYGKKTKPYYVEEHDNYQSGGLTKPHWETDYNALYCITELAYSDDLRSMMGSILDVISGGAGESGMTKCFEDYYQSKAKSCFTEYVYNKTAEMTYLDAYYRASGGERDGQELQQCLGDQCSSEREWQKKRCTYMSSYADRGDFQVGTTGGKKLGFTPTGIMEFELTPHLWLYPSLYLAKNNVHYTGQPIEGTFGKVGRVPAGHTVKISMETEVGSTAGSGINGYNHYRSIGNLSEVLPFGNNFEIKGEKLSNILIEGTDENGGINFTCNSFGVSDIENIDNLKSIEIKGKVEGNKEIFKISSEVDLSKLWRLQTLDLSATSLSNVKLPSGSNIQTVILPKTTSIIELDNLSKLSTFKVDKCGNLKSIKIKDMGEEFVNKNVLDLLDKCLAAGTPLSSFEVYDVNWKLTKEQFNYLLSIENLKLTGVIDVTATVSIDFDTKMKLLNKFGNIDDSNNDLYITYVKTETPNINRIKIQGKSSIISEGSYQYSLKGIGTDFTEIVWSTSNETFGKIDAKTGVFTFEDNVDIVDLLERIVEINCRVTLSDGRPTTTIGPFKVMLYEQPAKIGDYVYYDGTYASPDEDMGDKTKIAVCFYAGDHKYEGVKIKQNRLAMSLDVISDVAWGLGEKKYNWSADTPVENFKGSGAGNIYTPLSSTSWYINQNMAKDVMANPKNYDTYASGDFGWDSNEVPKGKVNTSLLIDYRDQILRDENFDEDYDNPTSGWTGSIEPNEYAYLIKLLNSAPDNLVYYPAASYCYAYEPGIIANSKVQLKENEILSNKFKAHNWFLPAAGELIYMWYGIQFKQDYSNGKTLKSFDEYSNENKHYIWSSSETDKPVAAWSIMVQRGATNFNFAGSTDATSTSNNRGGGKTTFIKDKKVIPVVEF